MITSAVKAVTANNIQKCCPDNTADNCQADPNNNKIPHSASLIAVICSRDKTPDF